jgi:hypothetical protein
MVSFDAGEVRIHEGYLGAPRDVLAAIVTFVQAHSRRERLVARRRLLAFTIETPPPNRRESTHPDDLRMAERLTEAHVMLNLERFGGALRPLVVRVSRRMKARLGHYTAATRWGDPPEIAISRRHIRRDGWEEALRTLLHEMVHQWQDEEGMKIDHGRQFRAKARTIGIDPRARHVFPPDPSSHVV